MIKQVFHKFKAKRTEINNISFASKKEARYYQDLLLRQKAGEIIFFLRQVPFFLPGNIRHVIDFLEFRSNGTVAFVDTKGYDTPMGKAKRKMVEAIYPVTIEIV